MQYKMIFEDHLLHNLKMKQIQLMIYINNNLIIDLTVDLEANES